MLCLRFDTRKMSTTTPLQPWSDPDGARQLASVEMSGRPRVSVQFWVCHNGGKRLGWMSALQVVDLLY
jgi:hypothetical protein